MPIIRPISYKDIGQKKCLNIWSMTFFGFISGGLIYYLFSYFVTDYALSFKELLWGCIFGVSVALPFGLIAGIPLKAKH